MIIDVIDMLLSLFSKFFVFNFVTLVVIFKSQDSLNGIDEWTVKNTEKERDPRKLHLKQRKDA